MSQALIPSGIMMDNMVCPPSSLLYSKVLTINLKALIRWKIVIHGFIDGKSRMIPEPGIRAHTNNRAQTVLDLFLDCIQRNGVPSRVRGDCGGENIDVARWMEAHRGVGRGSYIFGSMKGCNQISLGHWGKTVLKTLRILWRQ
jgi:hypothetical protein